MTKPSQLSRRERQIIDVLYKLERATAREIMDNLDDALSYSSVRTFLRKLEEKGHIGHSESGLKYVYHPLVGRNTASRSALSRVVETFFRDSPYLAVNSLLDMSINDMSEEELDELDKLIRQKRRLKKPAHSKQGDES